MRLHGLTCARLAMAGREQAKKLPLFPFLSLIFFVSIFFLLSFVRKTSIASGPHSANFRLHNLKGSALATPDHPCDYSDGSWIYDPTSRSVRYGNTCKEIFKGWNCISNNKSNALDLLNWRWQPRHCDLPPFDPSSFLQNFRDVSIGFVGDSLNRNMFVSLICSLRSVSNEVKKWRPVGADRGFTFLQYNLTIAYHRTNILARYGRWFSNANGGVLESLGYKEGYRVDVDIPEGTWAEAPSYHDILILNTGHWWWAPSKFDPVKSPMLFFEKGQPVIPPASPDQGLDLVLKNMVILWFCTFIFFKETGEAEGCSTRGRGYHSELVGFSPFLWQVLLYNMSLLQALYVENKMQPGGIKFFRTQSPRHFEGGDWYQGGTCHHLKPLSLLQVEELFSLKHNGTNVEAQLVNQHLHKALKGFGFHILDITHMSEFRADAHPSTAGKKKHEDCMHWCLPGITDTWNDLFVKHLNDLRMGN